MNNFTWNTNDANVNPDDGQYTGYLKNFQMKDAKTGTKYLSLEFAIQTPMGTKTVFDSVMVNSVNETAKRINNQKMASLCLCATGKKGENVNLNEVINKKIIIALKTTRDDYGEKQKIHYFKQYHPENGPMHTKPEIKAQEYKPIMPAMTDEIPF